MTEGVQALIMFVTKFVVVPYGLLWVYGAVVRLFPKPQPPPAPRGVQALGHVPRLTEDERRFIYHKLRIDRWYERIEREIETPRDYYPDMRMFDPEYQKAREEERARRAAEWEALMLKRRELRDAAAKRGVAMWLSQYTEGRAP